MAASYPGSIKSFAQQVDLIDVIDAADVNEAYDEIEALETELGVNPPDVDDSVNAVTAAVDLALRLDHIVNIIKSISGAADWFTDPTSNVNSLDTDLTTAEADITALQADYIPDTIFDAKGDILVATAADTDAPLTVGGDNRLLRANAGASEGLSWDKRQYVQLTVVDYTADTETGDGKAFFHVPAHLAGLDLVEVHAEVIAAGTTNTLDIQLRNVTQAADMLSTKLTIDSGETGSDTAAAAAVIDTSEDDLTENDLIAVDIDAVHTTAANGLIVTMGFA